MSLRAVSYARQSLDHTGEGLAVSRQCEDSRGLTDRRGWTLVAEHVDNDISASGKKRRPGFEQLLDDITSGRVDVVVAWSLDRLTRNRADTVRLIEACQPRNVIIALVRGSDIDMSTPAGRLTADILASVARHEIEVKGDRQRRSAIQRSADGRPPLGTRLTGYTPRGEIVPDEAAVVKALFERFAAGDSLRGLAVWLSESGLPTRHGRPWNPSTVRTILTNPRYAGQAVYCGQPTGQRGGWKPIVAEDVYAIVQSRLADPRRATNRIGTDRRHLGSGLYECAVCGGKTTSWSGARYRCPQACVNRVRSHIDLMVLDVIRGRLSQPDLGRLLTAATSPEAKEVAEKVKTLRARLAAIADDYDAGLIDGQRYRMATEKARAELSAAEVAQARFFGNAGAGSVLLAPDPVAAFDEAPLMVQRTTIDALCVVRLKPTRRGWKRFDPSSVEIGWRS